MMEHPPTWWLRLFQEMSNRSFHGSVTIHAAGGRIHLLEKRRVERVHDGTTTDRTLRKVDINS